MSEIDPRIAIRMTFPPRRPTETEARSFFEILVGPDRFFPAARWSNEFLKVVPPPPNTWDFLVERFLEHERPTMLGIVDRDQAFVPVFRFQHVPWRPISFESWRTWVETDWYADGHVDRHFDELLNAAAVMQAIVVTFDYQTEGDFEDVVAERLSRRYHNAMLTAIRQLHNSRYAYTGPWDGLAGIPWRLVLGRRFIEMFGEERLGALPEELGYRHEPSGLWVLQTAHTAEDSTSMHGRANEAEIIRILGREFFFDRETGELPTHTPAFPPEYLPDTSLW